MKIHTLALLTATFLLMSGCVSKLKVDNIELENLDATTGFRYALPLTQFKINVVRRAVGCTSVDDTADFTDSDNLYKSNGKLVLSTEVSVEPTTIDDMDSVFIIRPRSISSFFNKAGFSIEYHSGTRRLKTVNASVEDKSGPALISAIKTVVGLGTLATGTAGSSSPLLCKDGLHDDIELANGAGLSVASIASRLKVTNAEIKRIKLEQAKLLPSVSPVLSGDLLSQLQIQASQVEALRIAQAKYTELSKKTTIQHAELRWPTHSSDVRLADQFVPTSAQLLTLSSTYDIGSTAKSRLGIDVSLTPICGQITHRLIESINDCNNPGAKIPKKDPDAIAKVKGIYYREPAIGRLILTSVDQVFPSTTKKTLHNKEYPVAQLGFTDSLPVAAQPFESIEFQVEFAKDGRLVKGGYKDSAAPATSFMPVVETIASLERAKQAQEDAELAADVARVENEVKYADAVQQLDTSNRAHAATILGLQQSLAELQARQAIREAEAVRDAPLQ